MLEVVSSCNGSFTDREYHIFKNQIKIGYLKNNEEFKEWQKSNTLKYRLY